jgi:hypothetical protein
MNDNVLIAILTTIGGAIGALFIKKVDKSDFKDHCERQATVNDKFEKAIQENNLLLARVDERLKKE